VIYTWQNLDAKASAGLENCSGEAELAAQMTIGEKKMLIRLLSAGFIVSCLLAAPAKSQEMADIKTYCMSDIKRVCPGIEPGGGRIIKCLRANKKEMSVGCAQALQKLKAKKR
jgi:Cysteine rich repeat